MISDKFGRITPYICHEDIQEYQNLQDYVIKQEYELIKKKPRILDLIKSHFMSANMREEFPYIVEPTGLGEQATGFANPFGVEFESKE